MKSRVALNITIKPNRLRKCQWSVRLWEGKSLNTEYQIKWEWGLSVIYSTLWLPHLHSISLLEHMLEQKECLDWTVVRDLRDEIQPSWMKDEWKMTGERMGSHFCLNIQWEAGQGYCAAVLLRDTKAFWIIWHRDSWTIKGYFHFFWHTVGWTVTKLLPNTPVKTP